MSNASFYTSRHVPFIFQRESMKASKYEGMYTKATLEMTSLKEQLGQSKIDARMIAQEVGTAIPPLPTRYARY